MPTGVRRYELGDFRFCYGYSTSQIDDIVVVESLGILLYTIERSVWKSISIFILSVISKEKMKKGSKKCFHHLCYMYIYYLHLPWPGKVRRSLSYLK